MFETLVANLLNRVLGSYVENFDATQLNIGIWSGAVKLKNLKLKNDSFDKFRLPIDVKFGHLGELTLQIPWSNLKGKPVQILIENVYLLASPIILQDYDADEEVRRELSIKRQQLHELDELSLAKDDLEQNLSSNESFTESLLTKIVDNLQITIKNIHIRYEDDCVLTDSPYAVGVTLNELSAVSTDSDWVPSFISITQALTRKLLTLKHLSCYMKTDSQTIYDIDDATLLDRFIETIVTDDSTLPTDQFLLKPVSGSGKITLHKPGATESVPHIKAELFFKEFGLELDSQQYQDLLWTASKFHWYIKTHKFRKLRPKIAPSKDPKLWFQYTARSILNEIHERNYKWSWEYFAKRREQRLDYIRLWKEKVTQTTFGEAQALEDLEMELSIDDIRFYRSLARSEIRKQNLHTPKRKQTPSNNSSGWFSGWWGSQTNTDESDNQNNLILTEEEKKAFYDTIDYDESNEISNSIDLPRDRVKMEILTSLEKGGISIKRDKKSPSLAEVIFEGCTAQVYQRPDSFLARFQLQEFRVEDGTGTSLYKHIVSVKQLHSNLHKSHEYTKNNPFFQISYEQNPLDGSADSILLGKLNSMTIFYNPKFIEQIVKLLTPPKIHLETVGAIMNAAEATMEGISSRTRIGLQYALEEHKTINVKLDLQAPLIILPLEPSNYKSPVAILDAGHISVISDLVEKEKIQEIQAKEHYSEEDWRKFNSFMYDKFTLRLQDAQFSVGPEIKTTMEELHQDNELPAPSTILDKFDITLALGISILPDAYNLPKFKIGAEVPRVDLKMNDFQYKILMQIIDNTIPDFDKDGVDDMSVFETYVKDSPFPLNELDELSESTISFDDHKKTDGKKEKNKFNEAMLKQHIVDVSFEIDTIKLSLSRCIDGSTLQSEPLVDLIGDELSLMFFNTINDMKLDLKLSNINMIDHIENSGVPEFEKLVSSNSNITEFESENTDLLKVEYGRKLRIVEFNGKEIEVFDQDVKVDIAVVKFVISRKSYLSILNFILNTFTDPNAEPTPADELNHNDSKDSEISPQKINVDVNMDHIILVLNEDGLKLATLQLSTAQISMFMVPEEMEVTGKLGAMTLHDEINQGSPRESRLRNLISIEGDNLAEFSYKTFDAQNNPNTFNSQIEFTTGAITMIYLESSFNRILAYMNKFQQMYAIYDRAREAAINQASQIDDAGKMKFDVLLRAPTILFPKLGNGATDSTAIDTFTLNLGELYASNKFVADEKNGLLTNVIVTGIRNINMATEFNFGDTKQISEIANDVDVSFLIRYNDDSTDEEHQIVVNGKTPDIDLNLTDLQLKYLLYVSDSVSRALNFDEEYDEEMDEIEIDAINANNVVKHNATQAIQPSCNVDETTSANISKVNSNDKSNKTVSFEFAAPRLSLTIYNHTENVEDISKNKLASFALNMFRIQFKMDENASFESNINLNSFTIRDVREDSQNRFPDLIKPAKSDTDQFVMSITSGGPLDTSNVIVMMTVDNLSLILALDHIFELQSFVSDCMEPEKPIVELNETPQGSIKSLRRESRVSNFTQHSVSKPDEKSNTTSIGYTIHIIKPSIILLADPSNPSTEACVFEVDQISVTSQNVISVAANNIGMYLGLMSDLENKNYRIIDDFSVSFAHNSKGSTPTSLLTTIQASIDPMLIRVSLKDIRLALSVLQNATELANKKNKVEPIEEENNNEFKFSEDFKRRLSRYTPSILTNISSNVTNTCEESTSNELVVNGEELCVNFGGLRFVLIGDVHELPVLDMNIKPFEVKALNWSANLSAEVHIESFVNIFNYSRSIWEPLIEPWPIAIYMKKFLNPQPCIAIDLVSRQLAEITITSRTVALLSHITSLITTDEELKPRGEDKPYVIINETGYDVEVWAVNKTDKDDVKVSIAKNQQIHWAFEDWTEVRENLDIDPKQRAVLGVRLVDSPYNDISEISVVGEDEELYTLYPPVDGVHNRLSCDIALRDDNIKTVILRSTIRIKNDSDVGLIIEISKDGVRENFNIDSNSTRSLPIDSVYMGTIRVRPNIETNFQWSEEHIHWKNLMSRPISLRCQSGTPGNQSMYYFQAEARFDSNEPLSRIYPHMKIVISAPLEIENLLPFDLHYRLYDKKYKKDWNGSIPKGVKSYVHVVSLDTLLLLSVQPDGCGCERSEFAVINTAQGTDFKQEKTLNIRREDGQMLKLNILYLKGNADSTSLKIVIYSPYIILNRTGQNLTVAEKGRNDYLVSEGKSSLKPLDPSMFSFTRDGDTKNRALIKIADSNWTEPISFDTLGQPTATKAQVTNKQVEKNIGVSVSLGEGKYHISKVVTIAPRYIFRNLLDETIQIVESGSTKPINVEPKALIPLYDLRRLENKSLLVKFLHSSKSWSSPFSIEDIGQTFVKVYKENIGQILLKINVLVENATIFIQVENSNNNWPFSIRNFSDAEFYIYQGDPNINENGETVNHDAPYKPIYYKVPPRSVMPYAYDYPNAILKELFIRSHGRERVINLAEIGNLKPFRLPPTQNLEQQVVDLNVIADGPTISLIISNYEPSLSLYNFKDNESSVAHEKDGSEDENYQTRIITKFEGVGISLINTRSQELCFITLRGLELRYNEMETYQNLSVKLKWIQIDNQLYGGIFPIVLYPSVIPKSGREMANHPALSASICRVKDDTHGVTFIKYATILLQEMTIEIDEDFLFALLNFAKFPGASWNKEQRDILYDGSTDIPEPKMLNEISDVYFEGLHLQPMQLNLSFERTERVNAEDKASTNNTLMFFFNVLTMAIGNINDAPIQLNALFLENLRVPIPFLVESIETHYGQAFFYQVHKILGSADFIGNPVGLFRNLSSGVLDIFYEPYQGFVISDRPQEIGIGLAKGGLSFLKKSVFGFSDSIAKVTGSLAKGLSVATLDQNFQERRRRNQHRNKPKHALYGVASGANSFFESFASGVSGIAAAPIEGANTEGTLGFFKGLGRGVVGLPTKTAIGLFDLASNVSEGIRNTTTVFDTEGLDKVRLPRYIPHDGVVRPYSEREAQGQYWLKTVDNGAFFGEVYLAHLVLSGQEMAVICTYKMIILFQINTLTSRWIIDFDQINSIAVEPTGISLKLKKREGPFIPIPEKTNRSFLYNRIGVAVQEYNKHCQVIL